MAAQTATWDLKDADAALEVALHRPIWKSIRGARSPMPAPRHVHVIGSRPNDEDDG